MPASGRRKSTAAFFLNFVTVRLFSLIPTSGSTRWCLSCSPRGSMRHGPASWAPPCQAEEREPRFLQPFLPLGENHSAGRQLQCPPVLGRLGRAERGAAGAQWRHLGGSRAGTSALTAGAAWNEGEAALDRLFIKLTK